MTRALGCVATMATAAVGTYVIDGVIGPSIAGQLRPWLPGLAAVLITLGLSNLFQLATGYGRGDGSRAALLERARSGHPPADAGPMLVTGRARADGPLLRAPLSGRPCVAYEYRLYERRGRIQNSRHTMVSWWGYGSQPFVIDAGARAIRVAAMPQMEPVRLETDADTVDRVRRHVAATTFEPVSGALGMMSTMPTMLQDALRSHDGGVRRDWRRADADVADPATQTLEEAILPADVEVSVAGYWSPALQTLGPEPGGLGSAPVRATVGQATALLQAGSVAPHSVVAVLTTGLALIAIGGSLVWAAGAGYFRP